MLRRRETPTQVELAYHPMSKNHISQVAYYLCIRLGIAIG